MSRIISKASQIVCKGPWTLLETDVLPLGGVCISLLLVVCGQVGYLIDGGGFLPRRLCKLARPANYPWRASSVSLL